MTSSSLAQLSSDLRLTCQQVSRRVRFEPAAEVAPHEVSVLAKLNKGPRTPGELAELEKISAPSLTRTANCLVDKGLVARSDHPTDGRSKVLSITDQGREVLARVIRARDDWMFRKVEGLTTDEQEILRQAIEVLKNRVLA